MTIKEALECWKVSKLYHGMWDLVIRINKRFDLKFKKVFFTLKILFLTEFTLIFKYLTKFK